jgi:radical SAM protein with 4Fe4S-binding SPASM domain
MAYRDFSRNLHRTSTQRRIPVNGTIEVTRRCQLACRHCYSRDPLPHDGQREELTYDEHCRIIDEITDAGCLWLLYTGGEVFTRPDFLDIYSYAKRRGLLITIFTNGVAINQAIADRLAASRPFSLEITLYGATRETYEGVTGVPGSHQRCMKAIRLLIERKLPLQLKMLVTNQNVSELTAVRRLVEEELGLPFRFDAMIMPRLNGSKEPLQVRLTPEAVVSLDVSDHRRFAAWRTQGENPFCENVRRELKSHVYACGAGLHSFAIDPYGRLSVCALSCTDAYDLRTGSFRQGWGDFLRRVRERRRTRPSPCSECGLRTLCEVCPAWGELEENDPEEIPGFVCEVARLRAQALGFAKADTRATTKSRQ